MLQRGRRCRSSGARNLTRSVRCKSGKGEVDHKRWPRRPTYVESLKVTLLPEQLTAVERISEHAIWIPKLKHTHTPNKTPRPVFQLG